MKTVLFSLLFLLLSSCSSVRIMFDYDQDEDFSKMSTYKWGISDKEHDALIGAELLKKKIVYATDSILAMKQFKRVSDPQAESDFIVVVFGIVKSDTSIVTTVDSPYYGYYPSYGRVPHSSYNYGWYNPWYGPSNASVTMGASPTATTSVNVHKEGTVIFDIVNAKTKELVWRGMAEKTISHYKQNVAKQNTIIKKVVSDVFDNFPPPGKK